MSTIYYHPIISILENDCAGTLVMGSPGSGKTYFLLNIAANSLLTSCRVIFLDPKNDGESLKNIDPSIKITDINNIKPGALNPFKVLKNIDSNVILSIISCICGDLTNEQLIDISPIVQDFVNKNRNRITDVNFLMFADYLYSSSSRAAQSVGTILKINEDSKYGKILFSKSSKESFSIGNGSEVISLLGMNLPKAGIEMDQEQRFSSAIVYIICSKLNEILKEDNKIPTVFIVDEAHMLYSNPDISSIIDSFLVLGRSLNVATVLASQSMSHYPPGISQFIGNKFIFKSSKEETEAFLDKFDNSSGDGSLDKNSIINFITTKAEQGDCFYIDRKSRGGMIHIKSNLGVTSNPLLKKRVDKKGLKINTYN